MTAPMNSAPDPARVVEAAIAAALKPYTEYLVRQGHLTGVEPTSWHLWLAHRCADAAFVASRNHIMEARNEA